MTFSHAENRAVASRNKPNGQAFTDGTFCDAADGDTFQTTNPATGQVLASVAHCKAADVGGRSAQRGGCSTPEPDRGLVIAHMAGILPTMWAMTWQEVCFARRGDAAPMYRNIGRNF